MSKSTTIYNNKDDLHTLLDGLTDGEHVKATWAYNHEHTMTIEGPVNIDGGILQCNRPIRWEDGIINPFLTSLEIANDEEVTVTRDNEKALHELLDSLKEGETVTAARGTVEGTMSITGKVRTHGLLREVTGYGNCGLRERNGVLHHFLRSVTVRRTVVQRWEREDNE